VPPEVWNWRFDAPDGTFIVQNCWLPVAPESPVTGTPFCSTLPVDGSGLIANAGVHPGFTPSPE
jgi:hypothetical protein